MTTNQIRLTELEFTVPPSCQGQAVTYAYAYDSEGASRGDSGCIVRRRSEHGEPDQFELFEDPCYEDENSTNHEFWNDEPSLGELLDEWTAEEESADEEE